MDVDWSEKVTRDYRKRILFEADNPILAMKATRDRYPQKAYAGLPYLGGVNSEDALTWNVFRGLQQAGRLNAIADWMTVPLGKAQAMLTWGLAPEVSAHAGELQYALGDLVRLTDGRLRGPVTEPDIVVKGTESVVVVECKLGAAERPLAHLWEGRAANRIEKRLAVYLEDVPGLVMSRNGVELLPMYQLVRMAYFAIMLGRQFGLRPVLASVANGRNWNLEIRKWAKPPSAIWQDFLNVIGTDEVLCCTATWQALAPLVQRLGLVELRRYLEGHPCLQIHQ